MFADRDSEPPSPAKPRAAPGGFLPLPAGDRVGAHAGMMDTYLFLVASAVVETVKMIGVTRMIPCLYRYIDVTKLGLVLVTDAVLQSGRISKRTYCHWSMAFEKQPHIFGNLNEMAHSSTSF